MSIFYFSFCDPDRPEGTQWLGGAYVEASDFAMAMTVSHMTGCNPGGEIQSIEVPDHIHIKPDFINRLLDRDGVDDAVIAL